MRLVGLLIAVELVMSGCHRPAKTSTTTPRKVVKPAPKKPASGCKVMHKQLGRYSAVIISRCQMTPKKPSVILIGVAVLYTADKGKLAADEAVAIIVSYLGYRPALAPIGITKVGKIPLYLFLVTGRAQTSTRRLQRLRRSDSPPRLYYPRYERQLQRP